MKKLLLLCAVLSLSAFAAKAQLPIENVTVSGTSGGFSHFTSRTAKHVIFSFPNAVTVVRLDGTWTFQPSNITGWAQVNSALMNKTVEFNVNELTTSLIRTVTANFKDDAGHIWTVSVTQY